nr:hypothetical protein [Tanacetum cinerariifolium]
MSMSVQLSQAQDGKRPQDNDLKLLLADDLREAQVYISSSIPNHITKITTSKLQALIDRKKVIIIEHTIRQSLRLDDAAGVDCLSNEEIFVKLARMGYEKPRISNGFSVVDTPLFDGMLVQQQVQAVEDAAEDVDDDYEEDASKQGGIAKLDVDENVTLVDVEEDIMQDTDEAEPAEVEEDEAFSRQLEAGLNANINCDDVMKQVKRRENKRKRNSLNKDAAKKQRIDEEAEELKTHLQIVANDDDDDDVYTEATPLALKIPVVDYQIQHEHNKPYYKIIRADGARQLFLSFITLLKNFNREDLEAL